MGKAVLGQMTLFNRLYALADFRLQRALLHTRPPLHRLCSGSSAALHNPPPLKRPFGPSAPLFSPSSIEDCTMEMLVVSLFVQHTAAFVSF